MWAIGEIKIPLGVIEIIAINPPFYISRYYIRTLNQMAEYHRKFYINPYHNAKLPLLPPYDEIKVVLVHELLAKLRMKHKRAMKF